MDRTRNARGPGDRSGHLCPFSGRVDCAARPENLRARFDRTRPGAAISVFLCELRFLPSATPRNRVPADVSHYRRGRRAGTALQLASRGDPRDGGRLSHSRAACDWREPHVGASRLYFFIEYRFARYRADQALADARVSGAGGNMAAVPGLVVRLAWQRDARQRVCVAFCYVRVIFRILRGERKPLAAGPEHGSLFRGLLFSSRSAVSQHSGCFRLCARAVARRARRLYLEQASTLRATGGGHRTGRADARDPSAVCQFPHHDVVVARSGGSSLALGALR